MRQMTKVQKERFRIVRQKTNKHQIPYTRFFFACWLILFLFSGDVWADKNVAKPSSIRDLSSVYINHPDSNFKFGATIELGFLSVLSHNIQFGKGGTNFDYVRDGGQDNLFLYSRLSIDLKLFHRHNITFLYQPLTLNTSVALRNEVRQDETTFKKGQPMDLRYGFDFYRISYTYDVLSSRRNELSFGASLQLRNANIIFSSVDGQQRVFRNDVGPVPVLRARGRFMPGNSGFWFGFEVDGFYAPVSYLNGSDSDVVGAILDASLRVGKELTPFMDVFLNLRYVGGGGSGTTTKEREPGSDGFTSNWVHLFSLSIGVSLK